MRIFLMTCCLCFALLCGATIARAGEALSVLTQRFCSPLTNYALTTGCNAYWTERIALDRNRNTALNNCKNACTSSFTMVTDKSKCIESCQTMNSNDY